MTSSLKLFLVIVSITITGCLLTAELTLRFMFHLGKPLLYQVHEDYGSRPRPNQHVRGANGAHIRINNLSLRTNVDWATDESNENWASDVKKSQRILFLGDSVTYGGSYINNEDLFTAILERELVKQPSSLASIGSVMGMEQMGSPKTLENTNAASYVQVGNAGVNGWGVENMHGLIVEHEFLPASTYVTLVVEPDFYRSKTMKPYGWTRPPIFALVQVADFFMKAFSSSKPTAYKQNLSEGADVAHAYNAYSHRNPAKALKSAELLKNMDAFLESKGFTHHIFLSPTRAQVKGELPIDPHVMASIKQANVDVHYLLPDILEWLKENPDTTVDDIYYDVIHLTETGHKVWAEILMSHLQPVSEGQK